jgi:transcriptional regulator with XRE-family HTH domain
LTVPPHAPGNASRAALAGRLAELRAAAGLSGNALAKRMDVVQSRVWKIEHAELMPGEDDIKAWVHASGAASEAVSQLMDMLAEARTEQAFGVTFRRKGGAAAYQDRVRAIEERSARIGEFQVGVIPGILQTADYARELVSLPAGLRTWGTDDAGIESMINARLRRQEILTNRSKRVQAVISEAALRILVTTPEVHAAQLGKLMSVIRLPSVELGVIGFGERMPAYALGGFRVYDDDLIIAESIAGERYFEAETDPGEVAAFLEAFGELRRAASTGAEAEAIIQRALDDLRP